MARHRPLNLFQTKRFDFRQVDEEDINQIIYDWLDEFTYNHNDLFLINVDYFWKCFYDFFVNEVLHHPSIGCTIRSFPIGKPKSRLTQDEILHDLKEVVYRRRGDRITNIAKFLSSLTDSRAIDQIEGYDGRSICYPYEIAEYANRYLVSVMNEQTEAQQKHCPNTYSQFQLTRKMVFQLLQNPKPSSLYTTGTTLMTAEMMKVTAGASSKVLYEIFKRSLESAQLPEDWLHTLINLKHKDGDREAIENYRPIGITCAPSKVSIFKCFNINKFTKKFYCF